MFGRILKGQYDVSEMSLVELIDYTREIERTSLRFQFFHRGCSATHRNRAVSTADDLFHPSTRQLSE